MPKVSVIVAAYNIEEYIIRCINSVINQTFRDIEILVVNDGSTDNTLNLLEKIKNKDERLKIVTQKNKGLIEARKKGLKYAKGEYILFIDGDDWLELECIDELYRKAKYENLDIVMYDFFWSYDNKKEKGKGFNKEIDIRNEPLKNLFIGNISPCIWGKFIKKSYIEFKKVEFPRNISFAEDLAIVSSLFIYKPRCGVINKCLYNYYQREGSITKKVSPKILEVNKAILFIKEQMIKNNIYDEYKCEFEAMIYMHLFVQRFLTATKIKCLHKEVFKQYKQYKIDVKDNKYIERIIENQPLSLKIRMKSYNKNYLLGYCYDLLRRCFIKNIYKGC